MTEDFGDLVAVFREIVNDDYRVAAYEAYGARGVERLTSLLERVRKLLVHVPYEMLTSGLRVHLSLDPDAPPSAEGGASYADFAGLAGMSTSGMTVLITGPTSNRIWLDDAIAVTCDSDLLVYTYIHGQSEEVEIAGKQWPVNESPWDCAMATPSFRTLEQVLERYVALNRRPVQCQHITSAWRDPSRLAFKQKPESALRDSLLLALQYALDGAQVRPELNQGVTRPVDIEVNWWNQKRSAIIEVKWLGHSGPPDESRFTTIYDHRRAIEGLRQLAEYLELRDGTSSDIPVMGYLFVFDARRRNLAPDQESISREDGLHFQLSDPPYPQSLLSMPKMASPFRCFMEPAYS